MIVYDVVIVGFGFVGYIVVFYVVCVEFKLIVFEGFEYGGEFMNIIEVENYLGFQKGIMGLEFMEEMCFQVICFGVDLCMEVVDLVEFEGEIKKLYVGDEVFEVCVVIFVIGVVLCYLGILGEVEFFGCGVFVCVICDGFFFKGYNIVVVGGGDFVMEEVIFFIKFVEIVIIIYCFENFCVFKIMLECVKVNLQIKWVMNKIVECVIEGEGKVVGFEIKDVIMGEVLMLDVIVMFVVIGYDLCFVFFEG